MKKLAELIIILLGLLAAVYGIGKLAAETSTMILPAWLLIAAVVLAIGTLSSAFAFMIRSFLNTRWHTGTFAAIIVIITVVAYAIADHRPVLRIVVPDGYTGEVDLLVAKDGASLNEIAVNKWGIGYITEQEYETAYVPKVIQGGTNISGEITGWARGDAASSQVDRFQLRFLSFVIPGGSNDPLKDVGKSIAIGAIDTARLRRVGKR